jgi:hypothetical protein
MLESERQAGESGARAASTPPDNFIRDAAKDLFRGLRSNLRSMGERVPDDLSEWAARDSLAAVANAYFGLESNQREALMKELLSLSN